MKSYALFQEYIWLVNTIYRAGKISLEEINHKWEETDMSEGIPMARSTFNRHKDAIQDMFGIYIECDKHCGFKYYIGNPEVLEEDSIQNWMLSTLSVNSVLSESKSVADRILLESIPSDGESLHSFIEAMKIIHEEYLSDISLESCAGKLGVHPVTLSKKFTRCAGTSFTRYVSYLRVCHAVWLLGGGMAKTVSEAALESGFGSIRSFNRVFFDFVGKTPGDYVKEIQKTAAEGIR